MPAREYVTTRWEATGACVEQDSLYPVMDTLVKVPTYYVYYIIPSIQARSILVYTYVCMYACSKVERTAGDALRLGI